MRRHVWSLSALLFLGCAARGTVPSSRPASVPQAVVLTPPSGDEADSPNDGPPGQDPDFVPPGHGGVPPGQARKLDEVEPLHGSGEPPLAPGLPAPAPMREERKVNASVSASPSAGTKIKVKGKAKGKAKRRR
jgi:hypothetical protein